MLNLVQHDKFLSINLQLQLHKGLVEQNNPVRSLILITICVAALNVGMDPLNNEIKHKLQ